MFLFLSAALSASAGRVELTVLQSTDLHGSPAVAKYAKWIASERMADPELLLVDCGDLCNGTFATWCDGGASMVSYLNMCKYDVWIPGNHEFRIGNENFKKDLSLFTAGSVLAANIAFDDPSKKPSVPILPWKMFTRKGLKIAIVGMASHRYDDWYDVKPYRGLKFLSPAQALKTVMPEVRAAKPDVIVVAMHSSLTQPAETETGNENWVESKDIYAAYPEIVLILQGHTHNTVPAKEFAPGRWIVQPTDNGGNMAKIRVEFDTASRKVAKVTSEFVEAKKLPATDDSHMPEVWRKNNEAAAIAERTPIVRIPEEYVWRVKEQKGGLPLTLVPDAMREAAGADAAIVSSRERFRPQTAYLTQKFFFSEPTKSGISVLTLTPEQLKKALAASGNIEGRSVGIDPKNLPTKSITVAFDAYDLAGCDGERMGLRELARSGVPRREVEINIREAVRAYMVKRWPAPAGEVGELKLYVADYRDRMAGAWMGQSVGVAYGAPTEFRKNGESLVTDDLVPAWKPERVNNTFQQDDLYVEMSFLETLTKRGVNVGPREAGIDFANSRYRLWCANANARDNLRRGIAAPDSSHPKNHPTTDDIDYQIESDFSGILSPGMPARVLKFGQTFGRIMNYGDGVYAGDFMGGMYAAAYFEKDRVKVVEAGLKCIPAKSWYAEMVRDMLAWYREDPKDWKAAWKKAVAKYGVKNGPRLGKVSFYGIDVKINGAIVLLGYLWGDGDVFKTMDIATRGGFDSDCNPSSALGVLGVQIGLKGFGPEYSSKLDKKAKWEYTSYTWDKLLSVCEKLTRKIVAHEGGRIERDEKGEYFVIPVRQAVPGPAVSSSKPLPGGDARLTEKENNSIRYLPCEKQGAPSREKKGEPVKSTLFVDSKASAGGDGSKARPFRSPIEARDAARKMSRGKSPVTIQIRAGDYFFPDGFRLDAVDRRIAFVGEKGVRFTRAEKSVPGGIVKCDTSLPPDYETYFRMDPHAPMFFYDGKWAVEARWPNEGWAEFTKDQVVDSGLRSGGLSGMPPDKQTAPGSFRFANDRPAKWDFDAGVWLAGYTTHDWAFDRVRLASYTPSNRLVRLAAAVQYGLCGDTWSDHKGRRYYIYGAKSELDAPGEYFFDRKTGRVDFIAPKGMREFLAVTRTGPVVSVVGSSDVLFEKIDFEYACGDGLHVENATNVVVSNSKILNVGGNGVVLTGGRNCRVKGTEIAHCGFCGVKVSAGDRRTLTRADHVVVGCDIHDFSRTCRTYRPAVSVNGCGITVRDSKIHDAPHSGVIYGGNEHLFEGNEVWDILAECGDAGAFYTGRDPTSRGNVLKGNYVHDIGHPETGSVNTMAFYIDDCDAGDTVISNRIVNVPRAIMIGGGHDNHVIGNVVERCNLGLSVDARGIAWKHWDTKGWPMTDKVKAMHVDEEPWRSRYPLLVNYLNDHPREPRHISIVGNRFIGCKRVWEWGMGAEKYLPLIDRRDNEPTNGGVEPKCPLDGYAYDVYASDEFDGAKLDDSRWDDWVWSFQGRRQGFLFARDNVAVKNGCLQLSARKLRDDEKTVENLRRGYDKYATAIVKAKRKTHYGYYECRAKTMKACVCNAFWLYDPLSDSKAKFNAGEFSEEIDIFEIFGSVGKDKELSTPCMRKCYHTVHCLATPYLEGICFGGVEELPNRTLDPTFDFDFWADYHTFGFLWTEKELVWFVDGKETFRRENDRFHRPLHLTFDCEIMFNWSGEPLEGDLPAVYSVDYFRHWHK